MNVSELRNAIKEIDEMIKNGYPLKELYSWDTFKDRYYKYMQEQLPVIAGNYVLLTDKSAKEIRKIVLHLEESPYEVIEKSHDFVTLANDWLDMVKDDEGVEIQSDWLMLEDTYDVIGNIMDYSRKYFIRTKDDYYYLIKNNVALELVKSKEE